MRRQPRATFPVPENTFQISLFSFKSSSNSFCVFLLQLHLGLYSGVDSAAMTSVAVAVNGGGGGKGSRRAVLWAVENLMPEADRFILVHVMPKITSIPTPSTFSFFLSLFLPLTLFGCRESVVKNENLGVFYFNRNVLKDSNVFLSISFVSLINFYTQLIFLD